jgi:flagellar biosynthesis protein FlhF
MNVRKFTANTSREAWRMVREALGPDAVILSNRTVDGGVEILALAGEDMASLAEPVIEKPAISAQTLSVLAPKKAERKTEFAQHLHCHSTLRHRQLYRNLQRKRPLLRRTSTAMS